MNILMTIFPIQDYGGIVGDIEMTVRGLTELGKHKVDFAILRPNDRDDYVRRATEIQGAYDSYVAPGAQVHTCAGWYGVLVKSYGSARRLRDWKAYANQYDLVIHEIAVPTPDKDGYWRRIFDLKVPQITITHDAHFRELYPHFSLVAPKIQGMSVTNHAGFVATSWCPEIPRAFVGAPHEILDWDSQRSWSSRRKTAVSAHVWKAWKHMDTIIRAAPYMDAGLILAGDGIERRYMTSKDKCKPRYEGIWRTGEQYGMDYRGMLTYEELFEVYGRSRAMIDMSWSKKYMQLGSHFNRATVEAWNTGVVPICVIENMEDTVPAQRKLFHYTGSKQNYVAVDSDITPEELGEVVDDVVSMSTTERDLIVRNGRRVLRRHFNWRRNWREFLKLADGGPAGIYPRMEVGEAPPGFLKFARRYAQEKAR